MRSVEQQAFEQRCLDDGISGIFGQRQPPQQALSAQLAVAITMRQALQTFTQVLGGLPDMLEKSFVLHALEHRQTRRGHQCVAMMGAAQFANVETARLAPRQQRRQGHATAQTFAQDDDIGAHAAGLFGK
ncbi:hypothetical protein D3C86_1831130 [compost metagenome]